MRVVFRIEAECFCQHLSERHILLISEPLINPRLPQIDDVPRALFGGCERFEFKRLQPVRLASLDSRAKCNRALCEPDLHVFAKLFEDCLKRSLEAKAFSGREIGGNDDVLDFLVGHFVDVDLTRQPAS